MRTNPNQKNFEYGKRASPGTTYDNMLKIKKLFSKKKLVTFDDMKKATGKKWVRGFFNALKIVRKVEAVRDGREIVGYRFVKGTKLRKRSRRSQPAANENTDKSLRKAA